MQWRQILIPLLTLFFCFAVFYTWTRGLTAFTVFSYQLEKANPEAQAFPNLQLIDQNEQTFKTDRPSDKYKLVHFVYLDCPEVCHRVNFKLDEVYRSFQSKATGSELEFLTISFDQVNDTPQKLKQYWHHLTDNAPNWTFALPYKISEDRFKAQISTIGVWIGQNPATGIYNHTTNLFLVSPQNKIVKILDPGRLDPKEITNELEQCLLKPQEITVSL